MFIPSMRGGGAQRVVLNLANAFVRRGLSVNLLLAQAQGPYLNDVASEVRIIDFGVSRSILALPHLVRHLSHESPDFLLSALNYANLLTTWAAMIARAETKIILTVHGTISRSDSELDGWKDQIMPSLIRLFYSRADAVVVVSHGAADDLKRKTGISDDMLHVIHNPVVTPDMLDRADEKPPPFWDMSGDYSTVISAGRLNAHKDFPTLIRAFKRVQKQRNTRLIIMGEGSKRTSLENLVSDLGLEDSVLLPGFVKNPYAVMARGDVFVLPSSSEGFGNVLVEAMALGVPVVSTDCPNGPAEILEGGEWGELVPVGDESALSEAICRTLENPIGAERLMTRANSFTSDRIASQYIDLMSELHPETLLAHI